MIIKIYFFENLRTNGLESIKYTFSQCIINGSEFQTILLVLAIPKTSTAYSIIKEGWGIFTANLIHKSYNFYFKTIAIICTIYHIYRWVFQNFLKYYLRLSTKLTRSVKFQPLSNLKQTVRLSWTYNKHNNYI